MKFLLNTLVNLATFLEEAVSKQASILTLERIEVRIWISGNNSVGFSALSIVDINHGLFHKLCAFFPSLSVLSDNKLSNNSISGSTFSHKLSFKLDCLAKGHIVLDIKFG